MPGLIVTVNATLMCVHNGRVTIPPRPGKTNVQMGAVLCDPDLVGATILGCTQVSATTKPCTQILSLQPGSTSLKVSVGGRPAYVSTLVGVTDGVPPGAVTVRNAGQTKFTG
jgi:hypothetical protein